MKRCAFLSVLTICLALPSLVAAQGSSDWNHAEVGVFADYFRLSRTTPDINFVGLGGRAAFNVHPMFSWKPKWPTTSSAISPAPFRTESPRNW